MVEQINTQITPKNPYSDYLSKILNFMKIEKVTGEIFLYKMDCLTFYNDYLMKNENYEHIAFL